MRGLPTPLIAAAAFAALYPLASPRDAHAFKHNIADWPDDRFPVEIIMRPEGARNATNEELFAIVEEMIGVTAPPSTAGASLPLGQDSDPVS